MAFFAAWRRSSRASLTATNCTSGNARKLGRMNMARFPIPMPPKTILLLGATVRPRPKTAWGTIKGTAHDVPKMPKNLRRVTTVCFLLWNDLDWDRVWGWPILFSKKRVTFIWAKRCFGNMLVNQVQSAWATMPCILSGVKNDDCCFFLKSWAIVPHSSDSRAPQPGLVGAGVAKEEHFCAEYSDS